MRWTGHAILFATRQFAEETSAFTDNSSGTNRPHPSSSSTSNSLYRSTLPSKSQQTSSISFCFYSFLFPTTYVVVFFTSVLLVAIVLA
jgi:hypothetical protein